MYSNYIEVIRKNLYLSPSDWWFKEDGIYKGILEHVGVNQGKQYLESIFNGCPQLKEHKNLLYEICLENDKYGNTQKYDFENFGMCSPTNLRYIYHSLLIISHMFKCKLNDVDVVEIGGGYGGLCLFLYRLAPLFDINLKSYSGFDLSDALNLQSKYLKEYNIDLNQQHLDTDIQLNKNSYLVSNYAYSEISSELQTKYTDQVLNPFISHGFLVWNNNDLWKFIDNKEIKSIPETPFTGGSINNLFIYIEPNLEKE